MSKVAGAVAVAATGALGITGAVYLSKTNNLDSQLPEKVDIFEKPEELEVYFRVWKVWLPQPTPVPHPQQK